MKFPKILKSSNSSLSLNFNWVTRIPELEARMSLNSLPHSNQLAQGRIETYEPERRDLPPRLTEI